MMPEIPTPPSLLVKEARLFDSEVIVPGQTMSLVPFFSNARTFVQDGFGNKRINDTNTLYHGALPVGFNMQVRKIVTRFEAFDPASSVEVSCSRLVLMVGRGTPVVETTVRETLNGFSLKTPYDLLELQAFRVEWTTPAGLAGAPFLMRVALVGDLRIRRAGTESTWLDDARCASQYWGFPV